MIWYESPTHGAPASMGHVLPVEGDADRGAVQVHALYLLAGFEVVVQIAPRCNDLSPAKRIADADDTLPSQIRIAGPDVDVIRHEPLVSRAEAKSPLGANDAIPIVELDLAVPFATRAHDRTDVGAELPAQRFA